MEISYISDYRHNYLRIRCDEVMTENYRFRMLTRNEIEGLLSVSERMINAEGYLYYDITSKQSINLLFENRAMKKAEIRKLFERIQSTFEDLEKYMLRENGLVLDPEFIYMDMDSGEYYFRYSPFEDCIDTGRELSSFLIDHVDNDDIDAVETVYKMAEAVNDMNFKWKDVVTWFSEDEEPENEEDSLIKAGPEKETEEKRIKPKKKSLWERFLCWLRQDDKEDSFEEDLSFSDSERENADSDATVYISRVSCSEHKLYGLGRNNKYRIDLSQAPITVGKLAENVDLVINDSSISRIHARFVKSGSRYRLQDLNSTNGTYKNGVRLSPNETVTIEPGDEVGLGQLKFIYR